MQPSFSIQLQTKHRPSQARASQNAQPYLASLNNTVYIIISSSYFLRKEGEKRTFDSAVPTVNLKAKTARDTQQNNITDWKGQRVKIDLEGTEKSGKEINLAEAR